MTQLVRLLSPASALVSLRYCVCWCQISNLARTMPPDRLHLQKMQTDSWLRAQVSIKKQILHQRPRAPSNSRWDDPDMNAVETQFRRAIHDDAAWRQVTRTRWAL